MQHAMLLRRSGTCNASGKKSRVCSASLSCCAAHGLTPALAAGRRPPLSAPSVSPRHHPQSSPSAVSPPSCPLCVSTWCVRFAPGMCLLCVPYASVMSALNMKNPDAVADKRLPVAAIKCTCCHCHHCGYLIARRSHRTTRRSHRTAQKTQQNRKSDFDSQSYRNAVEFQL